jgi:hypothetical protein
MSTKPPELGVTARLAQYELVLSCRFRNLTGGDLAVATRLYQTNPDGSLNLVPSAAYLDVKGGVLVVEKSILAVPEGLRVAERVAPLVSRVPNLAAWQEDIRLPVPPRVCHPYRRALAAAADPGADVNADSPVSVSEVEVVFGAYPLADDLNLSPVSPAFPNVFHIFPPGVASSRQMLLRKRVKLTAPIVVLDYSATKPK